MLHVAMDPKNQLDRNMNCGKPESIFPIQRATLTSTKGSLLREDRVQLYCDRWQLWLKNAPAVKKNISMYE